MITKEIISQIEGEASIHFEMNADRVKFSTIAFPHFRGMENILKDKIALDALVITPRVCGICGHSQLMASVRAIEDAYKNAGLEIALSDKAKKIREFTLIMEIIQNHLKWVYLVLQPELSKLSTKFFLQTPLKAAYGASLATKAIATFAGQWPHSSYMLPGGVTCDPTHIDRIGAQNHLNELISFFEKKFLGINLSEFLSFESCKDFNKLNSDISQIEALLTSQKMHEKGFSHDRFIVLGKHNFATPVKIKQTRQYSVYLKHVSVSDSYSPNQKTYAKNALYRDEFYETGPLSRLMAQKIPIIKNMHRRYKDSAYTRAMARVLEIPLLMKDALELLNTLDISQDSYVKPIDIESVTAVGIGVVEAPRGSLIHKVELENGIIKKYEIVTPTQFNIGSSTKEKPTPAQKAMVGLSKSDAKLVFRIFDVCSVCTTH